MSTKTPEQIAEQVIAANYDDPDSDDVLADLIYARALEADDVRSLITAAIEADRAQRQPADVEITLSPEDDTPGEAAETIRQIANLIDQGFTSGYHPAWNLNKEL